MNKQGAWEEYDSFRDKEKALEVQTSFESENRTQCRIIDIEKDMGLDQKHDV
jgi:hypothetical protein